MTLHTMSRAAHAALNLYLTAWQRVGPGSGLVARNRRVEQSFWRQARCFEEPAGRWTDERQSSDPAEWLAAAYTRWEEVLGNAELSGSAMTLDATTLRPWTRPAAEPGGRETWIEAVADCLVVNADLVEVAMLGGSLGRRTPKPGWSDLDLFIVLRRDAVRDADRLRRVGAMAARLTRLAYGYNILQLHDVVYSTSIDRRLMFDRYLPRPEIPESQIMVPHGAFSGQWSADEEDAADYLRRDIIGGFTAMRTRRPRILDRVMLMHRVYSFPFAFLQACGHRVGKPESFAAMAKHEDLFPGITEFYGRVNRVYHEWPAPRLVTTAWRRWAAGVCDVRVVNRLALPVERPLAGHLVRETDALEAEGHFATFARYLQRVEAVLEQKTAAAGDAPWQ